MPTYLLAQAARVDGRRYTRGAELPDHDHTKDLTDRGYASTDKADLDKPLEAPSMSAGDPKATERSTVLVSDSTGVHREQTSQPVTSSQDGPRTAGRDAAVAEADAEAKATGRRK